MSYHVFYGMGKKKSIEKSEIDELSDQSRELSDQSRELSDQSGELSIQSGALSVHRKELKKEDEENDAGAGSGASSRLRKKDVEIVVDLDISKDEFYSNVTKALEKKLSILKVGTDFAQEFTQKTFTELKDEYFMTGKPLPSQWEKFKSGEDYPTILAAVMEHHDKGAKPEDAFKNGFNNLKSLLQAAKKKCGYDTLDAAKEQKIASFVQSQQTDGEKTEDFIADWSDMMDSLPILFQSENDDVLEYYVKQYPTLRIPLTTREQPFFKTMVQEMKVGVNEKTVHAGDVEIKYSGKAPSAKDLEHTRPESRWMRLFHQELLRINPVNARPATGNNKRGRELRSLMYELKL